MKLLIVGATGATGKEVVNQALTQGHQVAALVRDSAKASFAPSVKKAAGNVLNRDSLNRALDGRDAVVCSLGSAATGPFKEMTMLSEGTGNLVTAMLETGVLRLVCITGVGAVIASAVDAAIGMPGAITALPITPARLKAILARRGGPGGTGERARLAVYLHGLAGDLAVEKTGQAGLLATDLARVGLPAAFLRLGR